MSNNTENKLGVLDKVAPESESQKDRQSLDSTRELSLVNFINSQIERSDTKNALKDSVIEKLKLKSDSDEMTIPEFIKLLEILDKADNDLILGFFNTAREMSTATQKEDENDSINLTAEDIDKVKKIIDTLKYAETIKKHEGE